MKSGFCVTLALVCGALLGCRLTGGGEEWACRCGPARPVTAGAGNDTEAAWSPDGRRIAFQTDRAGDLDLAVVAVADGAVTGVVEGPGHALYPAWTPDGGLVYAFGRPAGTAAQAADAPAAGGYGLRLWRAGETQVLTQGYWRDYTPTLTPDGGAVYFASTRGCAGNSASLWRLGLAPGATNQCVLPLDGGSVGAVQPSLSPDGRLLLWAQLDGFRSNWRLVAARAARLDEPVYLTPREMAAYAPRWSPDGRAIACTGFREGDPGWGIYLLEPRSGALARLDTGEGNSRSPAWSPDGGELVFENNRSGCYKLYRMRVARAPAPAAVAESALRGADRVEARLESSGGVAALVAADGARVAAAASGRGALAFERPSGLDFGAEPFYVKVTLVVDALDKETRIAAVGHYAEHPLGWQVFVRENGRLCFNARDPQGQFVGVASDAAVTPGKAVSVLGIRDADGGVRLLVDGRLQGGRGAGATLAYGAARKVCLGQQWNGGMRLNGRVLAFECGRGYPAGVPRVLTRAALFGEGAP